MALLMHCFHLTVLISKQTKTEVFVNQKLLTDFEKFILHVAHSLKLLILCAIKGAFTWLSMRHFNVFLRESHKAAAWSEH